MSRAAITLLAEQPALPLELLRGEVAAIACDCYVAGIERVAEPVPWGWRLGAGENIDHHAPVPAMARQVSSTNLALIRVAELGIHEAGPVLLTHTDCDSVLSAAIVADRLEPGEHYGVAAIAADHTGAENPIADLLQAVQDERNVEYSLEMLRLLETGLPLPPKAAARLDARRRGRERAAEAIHSGRFERYGNVWSASFDREVDGEFFPALMPEAAVIVIGSPHPTVAGRWAIKVRRGRAMPAGMTLDDLELDRIDSAYGGRWNAGSTKRGGGSTLQAEEWGRLVRLA